jgi:Calcineurin-like phosphoesterase
MSRLFLTVLIAGLALSSARSTWAQSHQVQWDGIARVVAFADVHGAYDELRALLRETGIVDTQDRWAAGNLHVVSLGDLLDRGADSRKVMDLLMRLQDEAQAAGGAVHVVLGNHEAMNLLGDLRYVEAAEYAAYANLESPAERAALRQRWLTTQQCSGACAAFDQKFPPGYFGHRAAFAPGGKYGRWLLTLPVGIRINDTLFMHAGPGNALRGMSLQELDLRYRTALMDYLGTAARLEQANLLWPGDEYDARPRLARERLVAAQSAAATTVSTEDVQRFESAAGDPLLASSGPNWYRGTALCNEAAEADVLVPLLQQFGAARLVIGHTPTRDARAVTRFDGRVVKLDAGMNAAVYKGRAVALYVEPSGLSVHYAGQAGTVALQPEGLFVAPDELDDASVLAALRDSEITVTGPHGPDEFSVLVSNGGKRFAAVFQVRAAGAAHKELAAYRLDRLLGLGLVPVTVERESQGRHGVLQGRPLKWLTQVELQQRQGSREEGWCSAEAQFQLLYAFDALIGNEGRTAESVLFDSEDWFVYATAHARAFGTGKELPAYLRARPPQVGAEMRRRLAALDAAGLRASLGGLLKPRELSAILARRDSLLAMRPANLRLAQ